MKKSAHILDNKKGTKTFLIILAVAVLIAVLVFTQFVYQITQVAQEETERYLTELSNSVAYFANTLIKFNFESLDSIASTYVARKDLGFIDDMAYIQAKAEASRFVKIFIVDPDGTAIGSDGQSHDFSSFSQVMQAFNGDHVLFNDNFSFSGTDNGLAYAVPIYEAEKITGAMVACNTASYIQTIFSNTFFEGKGFFHVITSDGTFVVKSANPLVQLKGTNYLEGLAEHGSFSYGSSLAQVENLVASGQTETFHFSLDSDHIPKIGKITPLAYDGFLLVQVVTEEAVSHQFDILSNKALWLTGCISLLFICLIMTLFIIFSRSNRQLYNAAFVDPVTQACSQALFEMEAQRKLSVARPEEYTFVTTNIAGFKLINDIFGIAQGDQVLRHVYCKLKACLEEGELVCRSFADHFDLLIKTCTEEQLLARLSLISQEINSFNQGAGPKYFLLLNTGVYRIDDPALAISHIRDRANVAQKSVRAAYNSRLYSCNFYSELDRQQQKREKDMENRMEDALVNEEFVVYLQPKMELTSGRITCAEALVRWLDPERGLIPPDEFIPFFEKNGFIVSLDLYVFERACQYLRVWLDTGEKPSPISVNLSKTHFKAGHFLERFILIQKQYAIPPELLEIELTETLLSENMEAVVQSIDQIHQAGFSCALDDFGSGYSSLNMLKNIHVDVLKLDKAFFHAPDAGDPQERAIVKSVVRMARELGMKTVSEGIETRPQLDFLREVQCDLAQGYVISRPLPPVQFEQLVFDRIIHPDPTAKAVSEPQRMPVQRQNLFA